MFWKRKQAEVNAVKVQDRPPVQNNNRLCTKKTIISQIEQLEAAQNINYLLSSSYGGGNRIAVVELSSQLPEKKKYILSIDKLVGEKLIGDKLKIIESTDPKDIADWIHRQKGETYN
jgi:hypothetical protein